MCEFYIITSCADCKVPINTSTDTPENRTTCPNCGGTKRKHDITYHLKAGGARVGMEIKEKGLGQKKTYIELKQGPSHSHKLGKPVEHVRLIDRGNDRYFEKVTDYESGELIHHDYEPLSEHKGHDTAKKKP